MIIRNIDIANLKEQIRFNKYCIEKYGCSFSDLSNLERKKVAMGIKNKVVKGKLYKGAIMENRCVCCGEIIPEGIQVCPKCEKEEKELAFRSSLWRLFREHLINQYSVFISSEVDKAVKEAHENGITDYVAWIEWVAGGKKGAKKNAKPKRSGAGSDVAEKQDGGKRHTGRAKRGSDV